MQYLLAILIIFVVGIGSVYLSILLEKLLDKWLD